ncbi:MAG: PD40 domain-containing protein, partial [Caldilineaceae bacterium]|nr:PD40 domain-containing protein [Caldilineaceae bacterium]
FQLSTKPTKGLGSKSFITTLKMDELMGGWQLFRQNLSAAELAAVRGETLYLTVWINFAGQPDWNWAIYLDDLRIVPTSERTLAAPLPAALRGDGAQPLLVVGKGQTAGRYGIQRMDSDGSNRVLLAESTLPPAFVTWSPDGKRIAYQVDVPYPPTLSASNKFQVLASETYLLNADGSGERQIHFTTGVEGTKDDPPGCIRTDTCRDRGQDGVDAIIDNLAWSPDGSQLLTTICLRGRWYNGDKGSQDCLFHLSLQPVPSTNPPLNITLPKFVEAAQNASWSAGNRVLFERGAVLSSPHPATGIWELGMAQQPPQPTLVQSWLTAYSGGDLDLRDSPEHQPAWAPDGRHFATYRVAQGVHYSDDSNDLLGGLRANYTIMIHDRQDPAATRMALYVDHGALVRRLVWSPDGNYLLYALQSDDKAAVDLWWLDVNSGATGRITNDGVSFEVDWLPTHRGAAPSPTSAPQPTVDPSLNRRQYLPVIAGSRSQSGPTAQPTLHAQPISFATLTPSPTATALPTPANPTAVPPRGISGRVFYQGAPVSGINIQLEVCLIGGSCDMKARVATDSSGLYNFPYVPGAGTFGYQVTYRNGEAGGNPLDSRYLLSWQEPMIADYDYAQRVHGGSFDIANLPLSAPANGSTQATPVTFRWQSRGVAGDRYQWFIDATSDFGLCDQANPGSNLSFTFTSLDCSFPAVATNTPIPWYVVVYGANGGVGQSQTRTVLFSQ